MLKAVVVLFVLGLALSQAIPCSDLLLKAKKLQKKQMLGVFIPQCETDGTFKSKQCYASTGECHCVSKNGTRISEFTRAHLSCDCLREKYEATDQAGAIGYYSPQCQRDGSYEVRQCWGSTGQCWCVNELGKRVNEASSDLQSCGCVLESYKAKSQALLGSFRPRCSSDGFYKPMQFHAGYGWCVDANGEQVNNKTRGLKACKCVLQSYLIEQRHLLGAFSPRCDADGTFAPTQCHEGHCWCARADGTSMLVKAKSPKTCRCYRQEEELLKTGLAVSLPDCSQ